MPAKAGAIASATPGASGHPQDPALDLRCVRPCANARRWQCLCLRGPLAAEFVETHPSLGMARVLAWRCRRTSTIFQATPDRLQRLPTCSGMAKEDAKPSAGSPLASGDLINGCYRLLLHNQDRLFLVRPFKGITAANLPVLIIPWDQVGLIRVLAEYTSCE